MTVVLHFALSLSQMQWRLLQSRLISWNSKLVAKSYVEYCLNRYLVVAMMLVMH